MTAKRKKNISAEGPVKIVGINHGLCLAFTLFLDGWKRERFADVTFYCQPSVTEKSRKKLRANRSVLAAASPFLASILPDCELENDVCITTELLYDEMFCVLEYIYSGKLLCSADNKEKMLSILKDFKVYVPGDVHDARDESEIEIVIEENDRDCVKEKSTDDEDSHLSDTDLVHIDLQLEGETLDPSPGVNVNVVAPEEPIPARVKDPLKIYSKKKGSIPQSPKEELNTSLVNSKNTGEIPANETESSRVSEISSSQVILEPNSRESICNLESLPYICHQLPIKDAVTIQLPNAWINNDSSNVWDLEKKEVKRPLKPCNPSGYLLTTYFSHTWSYGIYSSCDNFREKMDTNKDKMNSTQLQPKGQPFIHNWTSFRQPTFLISRPQRVYSKGPLGRKLSDQAKGVLKLTDIQNMKHHNGKIHVTLNGEPLVESSLPQLFHGGGDYVTDEKLNRIIRKGVAVETDEEKIDFALAKHFLQEEVKKKQKLQMKIKMFSERVVQYKDIAESILKTQRDLDRKRKKNAAAALSPPVKKSGLQVQCEQCGKMVLAARLSIHLKIHSGVKSHLCELCGRTFTLKAYLNAHIRINHRGTNRPKRFMCSSCGYTCDQRHKLEVHERVHTDERPFDCQFCDKKFREKGTLVRHIRTHTGEKPYSCNICGTAYAARDTYVQHYKRKHEPRPDGSTEPRPRAKHSSVVIYRCEFCQRGFYRILAYEKHRATHTGIAASVRCSQGNCDFTYSDMTQLKDHMVICHPEKIYTCRHCEKTFLTKQNLVNHQSKHDPNLGFHCSYCAMSLTTKSSLIAHEKTHTREKPYVCPYCGMSFHSPYLNKIHMRKHQAPQPGPKRRRTKRPVEETEHTNTYY